MIINEGDVDGSIGEAITMAVHLARKAHATGPHAMVCVLEPNGKFRVA